MWRIFFIFLQNFTQRLPLAIIMKFKLEHWEGKTRYGNYIFILQKIEMDRTFSALSVTPLLFFFTIILTLVCRWLIPRMKSVTKGKSLIITLGDVGKSRWNYQQESSHQASIRYAVYFYIFIWWERNGDLLHLVIEIISVILSSIAYTFYLNPNLIIKLSM